MASKWWRAWEICLRRRPEKKSSAFGLNPVSDSNHLNNIWHTHRENGEDIQRSIYLWIFESESWSTQIQWGHLHLMGETSACSGSLCPLCLMNSTSWETLLNSSNPADISEAKLSKLGKARLFALWWLDLRAPSQSGSIIIYIAS